MDIQFEVDSLDSVADESLKSVYVERDGKFHFDPDKYAENKIQSSGLKKKNSDLIAKEKEYKAVVQRFERFKDVDDDELSEFDEWRANKGKEPAADANKGKGADELQSNFDKATKRLTDKHTAELAERDKVIAAQDEKLKGYELTTPIRDAALKAGVIPEDLELVLKDVSGRIVLNENRKIVVLDDDGYETDVTLDKYFGMAYRELRPKFYAPSGASGSGAPSSTSQSGGKRSMRRSDWKSLPAGQQQAFMKDVSAGKALLVD